MYPHRENSSSWRKLQSDPAKLSELSYQHDNVRPHSAKTTKYFFERCGVKEITQALHSPDFNSLDRWVNCCLKTKLRLTNVKEVEVTVLQAICDILF